MIAPATAAAMTGAMLSPRCPRMQRGHDQDRLARQRNPHAFQADQERERPIPVFAKKLMEGVKQFGASRRALCSAFHRRSTCSTRYASPVPRATYSPQRPGHSWSCCPVAARFSSPLPWPCLQSQSAAGGSGLRACGDSPDTPCCQRVCPRALRRSH
jgi:hypothetical protein